ncbi:hypothetical protein [Streptomyces lydicamycinicus]|uniref:hypothetical protein n=1 Tax=Streptomyces lydicamycinicus TaxID=1546107 RepID=UPI003C2E4F2B
MVHVTQTCRCGGILHPDPAPNAERYRLPMVHPDGCEECPANRSHIGLPEHLTGG